MAAKCCRKLVRLAIANVTPLQSVRVVFDSLANRAVSALSKLNSLIFSLQFKRH